jgi:hypothetical protein
VEGGEERATYKDDIVSIAVCLGSICWMTGSGRVLVTRRAGDAPKIQRQFDAGCYSGCMVAWKGFLAATCEDLLDGKELAYKSAFVIWDINTGQKVGQLSSTGAETRTVAVSCDGELLITCSLSSELKLNLKVWKEGAEHRNWVSTRSQCFQGRCRCPNIDQLGLLQRWRLGRGSGSTSGTPGQAQ